MESFELPGANLTSVHVMSETITVGRRAGGSIEEAVLAASRVLVAISARSLGGQESGVTLPQYRALVVLQARGPQSLQRLAEELRVVPSSATRMCDRLVRKELIQRGTASDDRREVQLAITTRGTAVVSAVTEVRQVEISRIVNRMSDRRRADFVAALEEFSVAAGEPADDKWFLGWT